MGRNFRPIGWRVLALKNSVTEVSLPRTIFTAPSTDIDFAAPTSKALASGTAASAARFTAATNSSMRLP